MEWTVRLRVGKMGSGTERKRTIVKNGAVDVTYITN